MENLFMALLLLSILGLIIGLIQPKLFSKILKQKANRKTIGLIFGSAFVLFFILFGISAPKTGQKTSTPTKTTQPATNTGQNVAPSQAPTPTTTESVKTEEAKPAETTASVTRNDLIQLFPEFNFSSKTPIDGKDNYVAQSPNKLVIIQIVGLENAPEEITMTTMFGADSINQSETNTKYKDRLLNKLTPNLGIFPNIAKETDTKTVDGFNVVFTTTSLGSGVFSETYSFKPVK